jgi:hypothetical protein
MTAQRLRAIVLSAVLLTIVLALPPMLAGALSPPALKLVQPSEAKPAADLRLVESDARGVVLELDTPAYSILSRTIDTTLYHAVSAPGLTAISLAGEPALPAKGALLGIPAGVDIEVEVLEIHTEVLPGHYRVAAAPYRVVSEDRAGWPVLVAQSLTEEPVVYQEDRFYPAAPVQVTASGYVRDQRVARVALYPFQFNPVTGQLVYHRHLKAALRFKGAAISGPESRASTSQGAFETVLANTLLNYESARVWRSTPSVPTILPTMTAEDGGPACKIDVESEGIYEVTCADLQAVGCDLESADPHTLQMHNRGQEIAITVTSGEDGAFDGDDTVRFYGQRLDTKYSSTNVYWLTAGTSPGLRIEEVDGHPVDPAPVAEAFSTTVHIEQNYVYWPAPTPSSGRDYWFWERLRAAPGSPVTATYTLTLPHVATGTFTTTLRVAVKSRYNEPAYDPDHHLRLHWNDGLVEDTTWDGERVRLMTFDLPQSSLVDGVNTLQVVLPGDLDVPFDAIYFDWFEIDYYRRYQAEGDRLAFASDTAGERRFEVAGFSQPAIQLYDITQPAVPTQIVSTTAVPVSDTFTLQFQATITSPRHYLALTGDQVSRPARITLDTPSNLHSPNNGADHLIITHADFDIVSKLCAWPTVMT